MSLLGFWDVNFTFPFEEDKEMYRGGLDRFKKAQSLEPFSVSLKSSSASTSSPKENNQIPGNPNPNGNSLQQSHLQNQWHGATKQTAVEVAVPAQPITQVGGGQSTWQPPDWAIEPRSGVHYLEVLKDGEILGRINLDKKKHIFGRQVHTCDFVLDHPSVSRQHAAIVPHKNGSIYVIDLGSVHGTFVANERLVKDTPIELEVGQSVRFAASTRSYILRKNHSALCPAPIAPTEIDLPSPPDPSDEEAVVAYNTILNRYGLNKSEPSIKSDDHHSSRPFKRTRKSRVRVAFKDQIGGSLFEVVGISDGVDVETEPGPIGVKEGSLVGKYESLVQITVIPKGKEQISQREDSISPKGVTDKLQQVLNRVKSSSKGGIYDDIYGDSFSGKVGSSWAYKSDDGEGITNKLISEKLLTSGKLNDASAEDSDDLFGD